MQIRVLSELELKGRAGMQARIQKLVSPTTITLNWKPRFNNLCSICWVIESNPTYDSARISSADILNHYVGMQVQFLLYAGELSTYTP